MKGHPKQWVDASIDQVVDVNKAGFSFIIWKKGARKDKRLGTLTVSVGSLTWAPPPGRPRRRRSWRQVEAWFTGRDSRSA